MDLTPPAPPAPYRRLSLFDLMGLVVAIGVGLGLWLVHARDVSYWAERKYLLPESLREWINLGSDCGLGLAWLVVVSGLRRPHPQLATYGSVACLAVVVTTAVVALDDVTREYHEIRVWDLASLGHHAVLSYVYAPWNLAAPAAAVLVGWLVLGRVAGRRRATGTLDRLGCAVGGWFLLAFAVKTVDEVRLLIERAQGPEGVQHPIAVPGPAWLSSLPAFW